MDLLINSESNVNENFYELLTNDSTAITYEQNDQMMNFTHQSDNIQSPFYSNQNSPFSSVNSTHGTNLYINDNLEANTNSNALNIDDFILNDWSVGANFLTHDLTAKPNQNEMFNFTNPTNCSSNSDNDSDSGVCSVSSNSSDSPKPLNADSVYQTKSNQFLSSSSSSVIQLEDSNDSTNNQTIIEHNVMDSNSFMSIPNQINTDQLMLIDSSFYETELSSLMGSPPSVSSSNSSCYNETQQQQHIEDKNANFNSLINDSSVDNLILDSEIANSEALLDNIEQMLKKMQDDNEADQINQIMNNSTNKNFIKQEPNETTGTVFKKISPKPPNSGTSKQLKPLLSTISKTTNSPVKLANVPVLTVPSPASLQNNKIKIVQSNQITSNDLMQFLNNQTNNNAFKTPIINTVLPQNQQLILATLPANSLNTSNGIPIIITTASNSTASQLKIMSPPNTPSLGSSNKPILIDDNIAKDSPKAKKLKQDTNDKVPIITLPKLEEMPQSPQSPLILTTNHVITNSSLSPGSSNLDPNLIKKQSRMIKNRESACLSRKRKKEYMQSLEDSLKDAAQVNEELKKENQQLKEKCLVLETENKLLKEQQKHYSVKVIDTSAFQTKPKITLNTLKTSPLNIIKNGTHNVTSLKRPFIMLAVFMVFGLNMIQFISDNSSNTLQPYSLSKNDLYDSNAARLAALASAKANDGALMDLKNTAAKQFHPRSRHLLSDYDYSDDLNDSISKNNHQLKNNFTKTNNLTKNDNSSLDLVLINGTWHLIDLNFCQKLMSSDQNDFNSFYNFTHLNKINNELNGWFERHLKLNKNNNNEEPGTYSGWSGFVQEKQNKLNHRAINSAQDSATYPSATRFKNHQNKRQSDQKIEKSSNENFPVSLYNSQKKQYDNFARSVRQRNDTFYYVSFRRDHVIFPALNQNKTKRPRISLMVPAMLSANLNDSQNKDHVNHKIAFMQIDCEVVDTRLFYIKTDDIPEDYMKILSENFIRDGPTSTTYNRN